MALKCRCICGCKLLVSSGSAGKRIKCPNCERKLRVPVDVVEKRRAQLEAKKTTPKPEPSPKPSPTPPRSKIEKPLSAFVDLPDPEPPPINTSSNEPVAAKVQPPQPSEPIVTQSPPEPVAVKPAAEKPAKKAEALKKPPPLPTKRAERVQPLAKQDEVEAPAKTGEDEVAPSLLASTIEPASRVDALIRPQRPEESKQLQPAAEADDVEIPVRGYIADRDKVATVRWLAAALLITGLVGMVPAIIDVVEHMLSETSDGVSRWACALLLIGMLQSAYAMYLVQLPDWSSVWVVTIFTLALAAGYAAMFGLTLLSTDQGHFVQILELADRVHGGKATAWCLIMLSLMSLTSYFSGRVGVRWRNAFVA